MNNILSFQNFINEYRQVNYRPINQLEIKLLKDFKEILFLIKEIYFEKKLNISNLNEYLSKLSKYTNTFKFMNDIFKQLEAINNDHIETQRLKKVKGDIKNKILNLKEEFYKRFENITKNNSVFDISDQLTKLFDQINKSERTEEYIIKSHLRNIFEKSFTIFSDSTDQNLITNFGIKDINKLLELDLIKHKYTYLKNTLSNTSDFFMFVYFMQKLSSEYKPHKKMNKTEFVGYSKFIADRKKYDTVLLPLVNKLLYNNEKKLVPQILQLIKEFPELNDAHNAYKKKTKIVYRGIGLNDVDLYKKILRGDISSEDNCVSTSLREKAAYNFAVGRGHLESEYNDDGDINRRYDYSIIIKYEVNPDAIILDTRIFGSVFGEEEILINPHKAKVLNISNV